MHCRTPYIVFLILLLAGPAALAVDCDFCGKAVSGRYMTYSKPGVRIQLCRSCERHSAYCDACKIPMRASERVLIQGEKLCRACSAKAMHCGVCRKRITGHYVRDHDSQQVFCRQCYDRSPKCAHCQRPFQRTSLDRYGLCTDCNAKLPACRACGKPVIGDRYSFKFEDGAFCEDCIQNRPSCYACGVPVGNRYFTFPDGRAMCAECNGRGILKRDEAEKVLQEAQRVMKQRLGMEIHTPFELVLEALNAKGQVAASLAKMTEGNGSPLGGAELGLFRRQGNDFTIYLLYGMPEEIMLETAAHELTHAWQAENCPDDQSDRIREGFPQWVAAQVLRVKGHGKTFAKLEGRSDHPYGTGYQFMKGIAKRYGTRGLVKRVKTMR